MGKVIAVVTRYLCLEILYIICPVHRVNTKFKITSTEQSILFKMKNVYNIWIIFPIYWKNALILLILHWWFLYYLSFYWFCRKIDSPHLVVMTGHWGVHSAKCRTDKDNKSSCKLKLSRQPPTKLLWKKRGLFQFQFLY